MVDEKSIRKELKKLGLVAARGLHIDLLVRLLEQAKAGFNKIGDVSVDSTQPVPVAPQVDPTVVPDVPPTPDVQEVPPDVTQTPVEVPVQVDPVIPDVIIVPEQPPVDNPVPEDVVPVVLDPVEPVVEPVEVLPESPLATPVQEVTPDVNPLLENLDGKTWQEKDRFDTKGEVAPVNGVII